MPTDYQKLAARTVAGQMALYEKEVTAALQKALVSIRANMAAVYEKYAVDGVLSYAEMTTANRLVTAEKQIVADLNKALSANLTTFDKLHPEMYNESFFHTAWAIDQTAGLRLDYGRLNVGAIRANLASKEFADALKNYSPVQRGRIRDAINNGLVRGQGYPDMMRDLKAALSMTRGDAFLVVRTEGQRAVNAGTAAAYADAEGDGVEGDQIWVATKDGKTRDTHQAMDGQKRGEDGIFNLPDGETAAYPLHSSLSAKNVCNCRCTMRYEIEGYSPDLMRTRDGGLAPYQPYSEWRPPVAPR